MKTLLLATVVAFPLLSLLPTSARGPSLDQLRQGQVLHGFRAVAAYEGATGAAPGARPARAPSPMGARFVHIRTGFTLDLLRLETAPQAFVWVNTFLVSDMGEPHTQEHLLLGKGNVGRAVANMKSYSLVSSSAFVTQWRTQYHFNAPAGPAVFFRILEAQLNALLNPDYTDEEIGREVRNIGVAEDPDGTLRLEEKGTVYQEMVSSFERPGSRLFRVAGHALYGEDHPLAMSAGGWPSAIREMTPEHIRAFHGATHHLGNMGMVAALPRSESLNDVLRNMDRILTRLRTEGPAARGPFPTEADLPAPASLPRGGLHLVEYPHKNPEQPSPLLFAWRPERTLDVGEQALLGLFLSNFAGDPTTNLYRIFVDTETREVDLGAQSVGSGSASDQGHPVYVHLSDVVPSRATPERLTEARDRIMAELRTIARGRMDRPELREFNERLRGRVIELRREMSNFASQPPGFGQRFASDRWATHLHRLASQPGFRKSVTLEPQLRGDRTSPRDRGEHLESAHWCAGRCWIRPRTSFMSRPSPELVERDERERRERLQGEASAPHGPIRTGRRAGSDPSLRRRIRRRDCSTGGARFDASHGTLPGGPAAGRSMNRWTIARCANGSARCR
jgi:hypothetical protein